jgi:hypothetical protein
MEGIERDLNTMRYVFSSQYPPYSATPPRFAPKILEMGPGTGILSTYTSNILSSSPILQPLSLEQHTPSKNDLQFAHSDPELRQRSHPALKFSPYTLALDINPLAVQVTSQTYANNNVSNQETVVSNLLEAFPTHHYNSIDLLLFNPPYVPTEEHEHQNVNQDDMIMNAYAGGAKGRVILDRLIPAIPSLFHSPSTLDHDELKDFIFYCVFLWPHNDITDLNAQMTNSMKHHFHVQEQSSNGSIFEFSSHLIMARQCGLEALAIVRFMPKWTFLKLPSELRTAHPIANEENMQAVFKPKLHPFVQSVSTGTNDEQQETPSAEADNHNDDDDDDEESGSECEDGFALF